MRNGMILDGVRYTPATLPVKIRATYDCVFWPDPEDEDYAEWGGWCDPHNPWGTADNEWVEDDDSDAFGRGEPIEIELPFDEAVAFLVVFPGAIWDTGIECDADQDYRTGVYTRVTAHVGRHDEDRWWDVLVLDKVCKLTRRLTWRR